MRDKCLAPSKDAQTSMTGLHIRERLAGTYAGNGAGQVKGW